MTASGAQPENSTDTEQMDAQLDTMPEHLQQRLALLTSVDAAVGRVVVSALGPAGREQLGAFEALTGNEPDARLTAYGHQLAERAAERFDVSVGGPPLRDWQARLRRSAERARVLEATGLEAPHAAAAGAEPAAVAVAASADAIDEAFVEQLGEDAHGLSITAGSPEERQEVSDALEEVADVSNAVRSALLATGTAAVVALSAAAIKTVQDHLSKKTRAAVRVVR